MKLRTYLVQTGICAAVAAILNMPLVLAGSTLQSPHLPSSGRLAYMTMPWNGDEASVARARAAVEARAKLPGFDDYVGECEVKAKAAPKDNIAQFVWAYACWIQARMSDSGEVLDDTRDRVAGEVRLNALCNTYDGLRLQYLYSTCDPYFESCLPYVNLGERLLKKNPNDADVELTLSEFYCWAIRFGEVKSSTRDIQLARDLCRQNPKSLLYIRTLANCYEYAAGYTDGSDVFGPKPLDSKSLRDLNYSIALDVRVINGLKLDDAWRAYLVKHVAHLRDLETQRNGPNAVKA